MWTKRRPKQWYMQTKAHQSRNVLNKLQLQDDRKREIHQRKKQGPDRMPYMPMPVEDIIACTTFSKYAPNNMQTNTRGSTTTIRQPRTDIQNQRTKWWFNNPMSNCRLSRSRDNKTQYAQTLCRTTPHCKNHNYGRRTPSTVPIVQNVCKQPNNARKYKTMQGTTTKKIKRGIYQNKHKWQPIRD